MQVLNSCHKDLIQIQRRTKSLLYGPMRVNLDLKSEATDSKVKIVSL